jgi:hypothetical protein
MSIGNTISEGNKGINFPWQLKMLLGQQCACDQLTAIAGNTDQVEYLLTAILTSLQASTDYEAKFVLETCPGPPVTTRILLEVRIWDQDSQQWVGDPIYYLPGNATPTTIGAGCTTEYTDPSGVLALILGAIQAGNLILTDIETNTGDTVTELQSLLALYTAGQSACASSLSVTLCTEQGNTLSGILTELQGTLDVNITNATLAVTQSGAWTVTSNQGTSPWIVSGTVALDAATLAALETITVLQGGSWTVALDAPTLAALESITVQNGPGAAAVNIQDGGNSITVDDGGGSITVDGAVAATQSGTWNINNITGTISLPTGAATEATLSALNSQFIAVTRTPSLIRTGGLGTIAAGARSISVYNAGAVAGSILGAIGNILPGEIMNFEAGGENDTLSAFAYDGTGTTLVITTIV